MIGIELELDFTPRARGDAAAEACAEKAERVSGFDRDGAAAAVLRFLATNGTATGEDLVDYCKALGHRPHDDRAFGSVFGTLVKRGTIRHAGYAERRKGHGTAGARIWSLSPSVENHSPGAASLPVINHNNRSQEIVNGAAAASAQEEGGRGICSGNDEALAGEALPAATGSLPELR